MLKPRNGDTAGYWLQLVIATLLATFGLALDSTAVVIGAMLIAPLMRPLVELAMGLATGSAGLVLRASVRTIGSIVVVASVSIAVSWVLPFHEITSELEARTAPSLLDLAVAGACALAAAYASLREDADIATTAAGTSIGISLVPPLCAAGYGIAIGDDAAWRGAALLFTANISGILAVATLMFSIAGFGRVDIRAEEKVLDEYEGRLGASIRVGRAWSRLAGTRLGPFARIVPPLILLAIVYLPLEHALREIGRRNAIRGTVADVLTPDNRRVVQYSLDQAPRSTLLRVVVVGDATTATDVETELRARLAALDVRDLRLTVWAVPDAATLSSLSKRVDAMPPPAPTPEPVPIVARRHDRDLVQAIHDSWPKAGTGVLVAIWRDLEQPQRVRVVHLGPPIGVAATELLSRTVSGESVEVVEDALVPIEAPRVDGTRWLPLAIELATRAHGAEGVVLCVNVPETVRSEEADFVRTSIETSGMVQSVVAGGETWRIVPQREPCVVEPPASEPKGLVQDAGPASRK